MEQIHQIFGNGLRFAAAFRTHYADDAVLFHYFPLKLVIYDLEPTASLHVIVVSVVPAIAALDWSEYKVPTPFVRPIVAVCSGSVEGKS